MMAIRQLVAAAERGEAPEDRDVADLLLGPTHGNDEPTGRPTPRRRHPSLAVMVMGGKDILGRSSNVPRTTARPSRTCHRPRAITSAGAPVSSRTTRSASAAGREAALARQPEQGGRIAGEGRQHPLQRLPPRRAAREAPWRARRAGPRPCRPPGPRGRTTGRHPPPSELDGDPLGRQPGVEVADQRRRRRATRPRPPSTGNGGDVDRAPPLGERERLLEQRLPPVHVGRVEHAGRDLALLERVAAPAPARAARRPRAGGRSRPCRS